MESATSLPAGTVTFLFTDVEGSTRLWEQHPEAMRLALARHDALFRATMQSYGGNVFKSMGDQFCVAFASAPNAVAAALTSQRALQSAARSQEHGDAWGGLLKVRMAMHADEVEPHQGDYLGPPLNRVARLLDAGHGGQILLSQAVAQVVRDALPEGATLRDLGTHRLKDLQQPEPLFQLTHPDLLREFPPLRSLEAFSHNLPVQLTRFVGREREMVEVKRLLAAKRLLTLTGSGGCGKTRLALQVASELLEEYADGVWLVELGSLADPALVPQAVASALGLAEEPGRSLIATLGDSLRAKSLLLVLDNCEHLLAAAAQIAEALLRSCSNLRVLVSSREALNIAGEQTYRVPSLSLPDGRHPPSWEKLHDYEAVQLFTDRARLSEAGFVVTPANASSVAQVCRRLDGIPLALELAAARVKSLSVEKLNERLDDMFRLLTGRSRTGLPRQQTLQALIDWSHDLLSPSEKTLFRRLSVFAGGWTLEAAEEVCPDRSMELSVSSVDDADPDRDARGPTTPIEAWEVLDLLASLVEKSLVLYERPAPSRADSSDPRPDAGSPPGVDGRYRLLETVRQYGHERLLESGEAVTLRDWHRDFYLVWAERAEPELEGPDQGMWLNRLDTEHDNLRAALTWSMGTGAAEKGLRLAAALQVFWSSRSCLVEGRERFAALLKMAGASAPSAARAKALEKAAWMASDQMDDDTARQLFEESLAIYRGLGDEPGVATSLWGLGTIGLRHRDWETARVSLEDSLSLSRRLGHRPVTADALRSLGALSKFQGNPEAGKLLLEESLSIYRALRNKRKIAWSLMELAALASGRGDGEAARAHYVEGLATFRELGHKIGIGRALCGLAYLAWLQGEYGSARAFLEEGLAMFPDPEDKGGMAWLLNSLGNVAWLQGEYGSARELLEESLAISRELGDEHAIAHSLCDLGRVAQREGDYPAARRLMEESLLLFRELAHEGDVAKALDGLAAVGIAQAQFGGAARLLGAAEALREATGAVLSPADQAEHDRSVAAIRTALGEEAFAAAWAEGRAMSREDAFKTAMEEGRPTECTERGGGSD